ncbi:MAG: Na(+)/H(+) antiporter subunit B [Candidatus Competibacterales bacterium]
MKDYAILRVITHLLLPFILLFALYVQFHGEYSPGGGFQAGVIFAAGIILYLLIHGVSQSRRALPRRLLGILMPFGVLLFGGVGVAAMLLGGEFLNYNVLAHTPKEGQHIGIILIELGVGITVAAVLIRIFFAFANRH